MADANKQLLVFYPKRLVRDTGRVVIRIVRTVGAVAIAHNNNVFKKGMTYEIRL